MKHRIVITILICAIFCLASWGVGAQMLRSGNPSSRPQWEYKSIAVNGTYWEEDGRQAPGSPVQELRSKFSLLGVQGWEMVAISDESITMEGQRGITTYWFKRPR